MGWKRFKILILIVCVNLFDCCTFGSVGNKLEEDAIILENFIRFVREIPGIFQPVIHSYDDQTDEDIRQFQVVSGMGAGAREYLVQILENQSFLDIERLEFRFNPPEKPLGNLLIRFSEKTDLPSKLDWKHRKKDSLDSGKPEVRTHTPFTIPLDLPPNDPYAKVYSLPGFRINLFMIGNSSGSGLGIVARNSLPALRNAPQGILAQTRMIIRRWDLNVQITQIQPPLVPPAGVRNLRISFREYEETLFPRCKTKVLRNATTEWILGVNYSRLFRDIPSQGVSLLNQIFDSTSGNPTAEIQITDISPFYSFFFTHLKADDAVFIQESCLL